MWKECAAFKSRVGRIECLRWRCQPHLFFVWLFKRLLCYCLRWRQCDGFHCESVVIYFALSCMLYFASALSWLICEITITKTCCLIHQIWEVFSNEKLWCDVLSGFHAITICLLVTCFSFFFSEKSEVRSINQCNGNTLHMIWHRSSLKYRVSEWCPWRFPDGKK